jgi:excisionase family DNA binding protein
MRTEFVMKRKTTLTPVQVSREEAAELLSCSTRTIDYLRADRRIKSNKQGKSVRIPYSEIVRLGKADLGRIRPRKNEKAVAING